MKSKIIATLVTLLIIGGIVASTVNETARVIGVYIAVGLLFLTLFTLLWVSIYQIVKIIKNED
jgi:hypothetical protein